MAEDASKTPSPTNFDRIARAYRWAEYLCYGPLLQQVRTSMLEEVRGCRQVLVLGDGDGRFLAKFLARHREAQVLAVDTSAAMLALLHRRCHTPPNSRLRLLQGSALEITPLRGTDLVVSHFFLDCLAGHEIDQLAHRFARNLPPGSRWLVSDFALPRSPLLRFLADVYIRALYAVFRLLTGLQVSRLPPISEILSAAGFVSLQRRAFAAGMLYSEVWQLGTHHRQGEATDLQPFSTGRPPPEIMQTPLTDRPVPSDAQSNPEPPVPSLPEPDPGVFHHTPAASPHPPGAPFPATEKTNA